MILCIRLDGVVGVERERYDVDGLIEGMEVWLDGS